MIEKFSVSHHSEVRASAFTHNIFLGKLISDLDVLDADYIPPNHLLLASGSRVMKYDLSSKLFSILIEVEGTTIVSVKASGTRFLFLSVHIRDKYVEYCSEIIVVEFLLGLEFATGFWYKIGRNFQPKNHENSFKVYHSQCPALPFPPKASLTVPQNIMRAASSGSRAKSGLLFSLAAGYTHLWLYFPGREKRPWRLPLPLGRRKTGTPEAVRGVGWTKGGSHAVICLEDGKLVCVNIVSRKVLGVRSSLGNKSLNSIQGFGKAAIREAAKFSQKAASEGIQEDVDIYPWMWVSPDGSTKYSVQSTGIITKEELHTKE